MQQRREKLRETVGDGGSAVFADAECVLDFAVYRAEKGEDFGKRLENIKQSAENSSNETAEMISDFEREWHKTEPMLSRFMRGARLEELTAIFARLGPLWKYGEKAEFFAEINRGETLLEHMWITEIPRIKNIF